MVWGDVRGGGEWDEKEVEGGWLGGRSECGRKGGGEGGVVIVRDHVRPGGGICCFKKLRGLLPGVNRLPVGVALRRGRCRGGEKCERSMRMG